MPERKRRLLKGACDGRGGPPLRVGGLLARPPEHSLEMMLVSRGKVSSLQRNVSTVFIEEGFYERQLAAVKAAFEIEISFNRKSSYHHRRKICGRTMLDCLVASLVD